VSTPRQPRDVLNNAEMRRCAERRLPRMIFDAIDGGSGDELTLRENSLAFDRIWFRPRACAEVSSRDLGTVVLGERVSLPLLLGPCGMARVTNPGGERAIARAAGAAGTVFALSGAASHPPEQVAGAASGPLWYQLYLSETRSETEALLERVRAAGFRVLCVTVDAPVVAARERDYRNRLELPPRLSPRLLAVAARSPRWSAGFVRDRIRDRGLKTMRLELWSFARTVQQLRPVTLDDIQWLRQQWDGPFVVKGVMRGDECPSIADLGVDGVVVSNHGGRQLDGARATIDVLPEVVEAIDGRAEVFLDGGVRRGSDVAKALALGARACLIGKAYMFGLGAFGEAGVARTLEIFRVELDRAMALLGCATVADIDRSLVTIGNGRSPRESTNERTAE
jgi:isopentenyl diphosphate isomerase/L-lactate dehydrogenase-like FMN-dependent dehydrogenase